jgi:NAD(P)H-hydrate epimerase
MHPVGEEMKMKLVSVAEMKAIEKEADQAGYSYEQMMEAAGRGLANLVHITYGLGDDLAAVGLVGSGNNGGDTLVALAALAESGWQVRAYLARPRSPDDPLVQRVLSVGGDLRSADEDMDFNLLDAWLGQSTVVLDGVFGTGIQLPLKSEIARLLGHVASYPNLPAVVAVDIPSGVDADSGEMAAETIKADLTITMEAAKLGMLRFPAFEKIGALEFVPLGLPAGLAALKEIKREVLTPHAVAARLPRRPMDAHKGTFGTALIVAGSINYTGAAYLAGKAAYLIGAGLVRLAAPGPLHAALAGQLPEATWLVLPQDMGVIDATAVDVLLKNLERVKALLFGPGLGMEDTTAEFVNRLVRSHPSVTQSKTMGFVRDRLAAGARAEPELPPLIIDADGLNLLSKVEKWADILSPGSILTPHPGEMSTLTGLSIQDIQRERVAIAEKYARQWGQVIVLKGALTVVAAPDGRTAVVPIACAGLAHAGTGDVLAGIITGLRAQGLSAYDAAACGAWIHADAGLIAVDDVGHPASVLARDVLESIPQALASLEG